MVVLYVLLVTSFIGLLALAAVLLFEIGKDSGLKALRKEANTKSPGLNLHE